MPIPVVHIIYSSVSGNVEFVMDTIAEMLAHLQIGHQLHKAEITSAEVIMNNDCFLFGTSTWEHGEVNPRFMTVLKAISTNDMSGKSAGCVGLGDHRYEPVLFNQAIKITEREFSNQGGKLLLPTLLLDGNPYVQVEHIHNWSREFIHNLDSHFE